MTETSLIMKGTPGWTISLVVPHDIHNPDCVLTNTNVDVTNCGIASADLFTEVAGMHPRIHFSGSTLKY
jgi:hypothetical protein